MAIPHANPGDVIDVRPLGFELASTKTHTLIKKDKFEVVRLFMAAGKEIDEHKAPGEITVPMSRRKNCLHRLGQDGGTRCRTDALPDCGRTALGQVHRGRLVPADDPPEVLIR